MQNFLEMLLPLELAYGASGGPEFNTHITTNFNGSEQRNIVWALPKFRYQISTIKLNESQLIELSNFFQLVRGRALGFRFRDFCNYQAENEFQAIANGIFSKLQLKTHIKLGQHKLTKTITKPVQDSVKIYFNNIAIKEFNCDYQTGIITFKIPPTKNVIITADFLYDIPVRFDIDYLALSLDSYGSYSTSTIPLIEIR